MNYLTMKENPVSETTTITVTRAAAADAAEGLERERIMRVVRNAADISFRNRVQHAVMRRINRHGLADLVESRNAAGINNSRWLSLSCSTRNAESPEEFQAFARVIRVSPKWLATGNGNSNASSGFQAPPAGWEAFGSHVDRPDVVLEFSAEVDAEDGLPLWERERK
jgi:hypothetical protein